MSPVLFLLAVVSALTVAIVVAVAAIRRSPSPRPRAATVVPPIGALPPTVVLPAPGVAWLRGVKGLTGSYPLGRPVNVVGRSSNADVVLVLDTVSRHQCTIHHDGAACRGMNVPGGRVTRIHVVRSRKLLAILDGFGDLVWRPPPLRHLVLPLLGRVIAAELPARLTWHAALASFA